MIRTVARSAVYFGHTWLLNYKGMIWNDLCNYFAAWNSCQASRGQRSRGIGLFSDFLTERVQVPEYRGIKSEILVLQWLLGPYTILFGDLGPRGTQQPWCWIHSQLSTGTPPAALPRDLGGRLIEPIGPT